MLKKQITSLTLGLSLIACSEDLTSSIDSSSTSPIEQDGFNFDQNNQIDPEVLNRQKEFCEQTNFQIQEIIDYCNEWMLSMNNEQSICENSLRINRHVLNLFTKISEEKGFGIVYPISPFWLGENFEDYQIESDQVYEVAGVKDFTFYCEEDSCSFYLPNQFYLKVSNYINQSTADYPINTISILGHINGYIDYVFNRESIEREVMSFRNILEENQEQNYFNSYNSANTSVDGILNFQDCREDQKVEVLQQIEEFETVLNKYLN